MADLAGTYSMSTNPVIRHTVTYETYRDGTTEYYRFCVAVAPITGASYFGYNLRCDISLNGSTVLSGGEMKAASPSQWGSSIVKYFPSASGWYSVSGIGDVSTLPASIYFYSSQTSGTASTGNRTVSVQQFRYPSPPNLYLSSTSPYHWDTVVAGVSGGSWGDGSPNFYTYQIRVSMGEWKQLYGGLNTSVPFKPEDYGAGYGSFVEVRASMTNSLWQTSEASLQSFQCVFEPDVPQNFRADPPAIHRSQPLTLRWSASNPNSGYLYHYELRVRYYDGAQWTDWQDLAKLTDCPVSYTTKPADYTFCSVGPRGKLEYAIRSMNSRWVSSGYANLTVSIKGGVTNVKTGGAWKEGQAYVKAGGVWKAADAIYLKLNGVWKEQV